MFGMSGTEIAIVLALALLLLGPAKLPGLARSLGKGLREFRRATDDLRSSVEMEFYRMDAPASPPPQAAEAKANAPLAEPSPESMARGAPSPAPALAELAATAAEDQAPAGPAPTPDEAPPAAAQTGK
ncbi:MAG: Sec-independent protein translocase subunit TatA/TatB [Myxococcales bacterium]|jgi:sec-independent protein translocase protein TatB